MRLEEAFIRWAEQAISEVQTDKLHFLCDHVHCFPIFGVVPTEAPLPNSENDKAIQQLIDQLGEQIMNAPESKKTHRRKSRRNKGPELGEPAKLSRHLVADWAPETKMIIASVQMEQERLVTNRMVLKMMLDKKLFVVLQSEENPLLNDKVVQITKEGFFETDGSEIGFKIFTITIPTGNGYGIQFRWDESGKVFLN